MSSSLTMRASASPTMTQQQQQTGSGAAAGARDGVERYNRLEVLGEGTYGVVYRAVDRITGQVVALKKVRFDHHDDGIPTTALREISILQELHHTNIVNLLDVLCAENKLYLVLEYAESDLKKTLEKHGPYSGAELRRMAYQLFLGIHFCHRHRIVHRDLKPANILVTRDGVLKLTDFGLGRAFHVPLHTYTHEVVTMWYRAPEILLGERHYTPAVDIWSVGCIIAELARGSVFFRGDSEVGQLFSIFQLLGTPYDRDDSWPGVAQLPDYHADFPRWSGTPLAQALPQVDADLVDLIAQTLDYNPLRRISANDALLHPYFRDMRQTLH